VKTEAKCGCCHLSPLCTSTWTDTSWSEILEEADRLGVETGINVWQERPSRTISANSKLNTFFVSSSIGQRSSATRCPRETLKIDVLFVTIDRMLSEFDRRFNDNIDVLRAASVFNPSCEEAFLDAKHISTTTTHYSKAGINTDTLDAQLAMAKSLSYCQCQPSRPNDILHSVTSCRRLLTRLYFKACWHCFDTSGDNSIKRANVFNSWSC